MSSFCRRTICLLVSMLVHRCQLTHKCAQLCIKHLTRILFQFVVENVFPLHIIELRRGSFISQEGHWPPHSSIHQPHTTLATLGSRMHPDRYINIGTKTIPHHPLEIAAWMVWDIIVNRGRFYMISVGMLDMTPIISNIQSFGMVQTARSPHPAAQTGRPSQTSWECRTGCCLALHTVSVAGL